MRNTRGPAVVVLSLLVGACGGDADPVSVDDVVQTPSDAPLCTIPVSEIVDGGVGRDGIPSLEDPKLVPVGHQEAAYLLPGDRVIGIEIDGQPIAVPHNVLWWHEIVNLSGPGGGVAVTFCPLTGSSLAFDRSAIGGSELGVSGLLWRNNLIMYDRETESLWPQMLRQSTCGVSQRTLLPQYPALEMRWDAWSALNPDGLVVSVDTGFGRAYGWYPYGDYDVPENPETLFPHPRYDQRRNPKERLLGIVQGGDGGVAFAYEILGRAGMRAIHTPAKGGPAVVFWDREAESAVAYFRTVDGSELSFLVNGSAIRDEGTGSVWDLAGRAMEGPLAGTRLEPVPDSYTAFWFAWVTFQPETVVWFP